MMSNETLPLNLYKANIELQLRITRLLQEVGHHWLESTQRNSTESIAETNAKIEGLLRSSHWQSLATLPSESFFRVFEMRARDLQFTQQVAIRNQAIFTSGLQQALDSWQKSVAAAIGDSAATQPLQEVLQQWMKAWPPVDATPQD